MIKRIYYYFKLKELLKKSGSMLFVNYLMSDKGKSLFKMCMQNGRIRLWFDYIASFQTTYDDLLPIAQRFTEHAIRAEKLTKRFFKARDIWMKQKNY